MILLKNILHGTTRTDILINDEGRIGRIGSLTEEIPGAEIVDGSRLAVIPGLVNMHTHAAMILLRGIHEDLTLYDWLNNIWKIEAKLDREFIYWSTKAACLEMIRSGTTTFNDQYWFCPHARQAALEMGVRPVVSFIFLDSHNPELARKQREACQRLYERTLDWGPESQFAISIHSVYTVCKENIVWANQFALDHGLKVHLHLSETKVENEDCRRAHGGLSPTEYFEQLGVWGPHVIAAHCLHLSDEDVRILGEHRVNCVHNIHSNLKLASGYRFRYNELRDAGVNVCIGTDGASSANDMDMLAHMKTAAIMQKAWRSDPLAMPLQELLDCATVHGAKALGIDSGVIREGAWADLVLLDLDNSYFLSPGSVTANLIYAAGSRAVSSVMVRGKWVMREGVIPGEAEILSGARKVLSQI
jgi:5-methylthioadenosine/S-adenosylhomocysteine deaminase